MIVLRLAIRSLLNRRSTVLLAVLTIALSVFLLLSVAKLRADAKRSFTNTVSGVDLIVGARTGAVQLLLYSVFHIGDATHNIGWDTVQGLRQLPEVAWLVPLSLGDSHRGFRVVGTESGFFEHYRHGMQRSRLEFSSGAAFQDTFEAVVGAEVAQRLGYAPGARIVLAHDALHEHAGNPLTVSGVLARTGTPIDRSVLVPLTAITALHLGWEQGVPLVGHEHAAEHAGHDLTPTQVTAALLGTRSPVQALRLQHQISNSTDEALLAILPGPALQQLWGLTAVAEQALLLVAACVVAAGLLGMLAILLATLEQRRREMALLRSVGAGAGTIFLLLLLESLLLIGSGLLLGVLLLAVAVQAGAGWLLMNYGIVLSPMLLDGASLRLLSAILLSGLLLGLLPAWSAYRRSLSDGLSIRI